jgi:hypothetical protein
MHWLNMTLLIVGLLLAFAAGRTLRKSRYATTSGAMTNADTLRRVRL